MGFGYLMSEFNRRKLLQRTAVGLTTMSGLAATASANETREPENEVELIRGRERTRLVRSALSDNDVRLLIEQAWENGLSIDVNSAVAKRLTAEWAEGNRRGVIFPLVNPWGTDTRRDDGDSKFIIWDDHYGVSRTVKTDTNLASTVFISDTSANSIDFGSITVVPPKAEDSLTIQTEGDSVSTASNDDWKDAMGCIADNLGFVEGADDLYACGSCAFPGDGAGVWDVGQCLWCLYEMGVNMCVAGYCFKTRLSWGGEFCATVKTARAVPLYLLPGGGAMTFVLGATSHGCNSDEGTDCTSPIAP